ncbi:MAG: alpha/beta hydrolase [Spirochaetes bacterium]|nr:alpha/beta hydrolase [Spirochaetota bacterium]
MFQKFDKNSDGVLDAGEIAALASTPFGGTGTNKNRPAPDISLKLPDSITQVSGVVYGKGGTSDLLLDYIQPKKKEGRLPVVVFVHGGGWQSGSRMQSLRQLVPLVEDGYFGVSIDYRLSGEAIFPAQIEDCKCAIRYLRANAETLGIDTNRIGVWGSSAGGHLVALLGTAGDKKEFEGSGGWQGHSSRVAAVCDWFGPSDLFTMGDFPSKLKHNAPDSPESMLIGGALKENKDKAQNASPLTYVSADDPPFLIMHGDKDEIVPYNQSEILFAALKKAGVDVTFIPVPGEGHGFRSQEPAATAKKFFDRVLKGKK